MFDNLFIHFGPMGTAFCLLVLLAGLTVTFSIGKHLRTLGPAR